MLVFALIHVFCFVREGLCDVALMSKEKKDPSTVDTLVNRVEEIIGAGRSRDEIRRELVHRNYNVNLTASAFLDST